MPMHGIELGTGEHTIHQQEGPDLTCPGCDLCWPQEKMDIPFLNPVTDEASAISAEQFEAVVNNAFESLRRRQPEKRVTDPIPPWLMPQGIPYGPSDDLQDYLEQEREGNCCKGDDE